MEQDFNNAGWKGSDTAVKGYHVEIDEYYDLGFNAAFAYRIPSIHPSAIILVAILLVIVFTLALVFRAMAKVLYRPVEETLKEIDASNSEYDEFGAIKKSGIRMKDLSIEQKYIQLIKGIPADTTEIGKDDYFTLLRPPVMKLLSKPTIFRKGRF